MQYNLSEMFKSWCRRQGFYNNSNLSHVLMDGGKLSVPFDKLNDFYEEYVRAVNADEKIYVVEQKTDTFNFFVDMDYKDEEEIPFDRLKEIVRIICDRVSILGGKNALISVAEPKTNGGLIKHGIHINWPDFVVDHGSAMALQSHIVSALKLMFPTKNWGDIIDTAVYGNGKRNARGSGFRMPWSYKRAKHEPCEGRGCEGCDNTGRVTQGFYLPVLMYEYTTSKLNDMFNTKPSVEIMHMATTRTQNTNPIIITGSKREEGSFTPKDMKDEFSDEETIGHIQTFIQKYLDGQTESEITKVYKKENIYLVSTNSKYCENLGRTHASNHVWFMIQGNVIMQKCFCTCPVMRGRKSGFCKDFVGRKHFLPDKIYNKMYVNGFKQPTYSSPQNICSTCPEEKKTDPLEVTGLLQSFINRHMFKDVSVCVTSITKKGKTCTVFTDYSCTECNTKKMKLKIVKKEIERTCCKGRKHMLTDKIIKIL